MVGVKLTGVLAVVVLIPLLAVLAARGVWDPRVGRQPGVTQAGNAAKPQGDEADVVVLGAGDQVRVTEGAGVDSVQVGTASPGEVKRILGWREGRLVFTGQSLAEVVEEVNRYNVRQLVISDRDIADVKIEGTFEAKDLEGLLGFLQAKYGITITTRDGGTGGAQVIALEGPRTVVVRGKKGHS